MTFSRFFNHSIFFFLLCLIANTARPIGFNSSVFNLGQPHFFEIPRIPQASLNVYTSILIAKDNRLFVTNNQEVFIYDGINYQQINVTGRPRIAYDGNEKVAIAGYNYLSIITLNQHGGYSTNLLIDPKTSEFNRQITDLGFDKQNSLYLSTGSKLWKLNETLTAIDSSSEPITIYTTSKGLVFHSLEKGYYCLEGKYDETFNNIIGQINSDEKILRISVAGSYFFVTTSSNQLLMFNNQGILVKIISNFGSNDSDVPIDFCSSDDINFFAITPTQIFRFVNPVMFDFLDSNTGLKGVVNSARVLDGNLYIATSYGLYIAKGLTKSNSFTLLQLGGFNKLFIYKSHLFAIGTKGLFQISNNQVLRITHESIEYKKAYLLNSKYPKAFFLTNNGVEYINLNQPKLLNRINIGNALITELYPIDSTLLLKNANDNWFIYNTKTENFTPYGLLSSNKFSPQFVINQDTLGILNEQIVTKNNTLLKSNIGYSHSNQTITNYFSIFHPNFQSFFLENEKEKSYSTNRIAFLAIENRVKVNEVYLDSDSTVWLSSNNGLIRISSLYLKQIRKSQPRLLIYSATIGTSPLYNGFTEQKDDLNDEYRVKQGRSVEIKLSGAGSYEWNNLSYTYKIDKDNSKWSDWSPNSKITLSGLNPGYYTCSFKARNALGVESSELKVNLSIIPSFSQTRFTFIALLFLILLIIFTISRWRIFYFALERFKLESIINQRTEELIKEKEKTDNLLARVLPRETATELKETGKVNTQKFNTVTVLFSDIQGFTKITDELNPENLIDQLDKFFLYFDSVVDKYRIEKIKTIGDAYMCAGGIPHKNRTNPVEVVLAALEMLYYMREINLEHNPGQDIWDLRIGIDTGPVIAGVVGRNKLTYDIWGTTVNTASRMESSGEVGRINISGNTHILVQDYFLCTYRGKMPIKNKGDIEMYFVDGIKPALSNNLDLYRPNAEFQVQLQFLRFGDIEEFILEKLEKGLPKNLYYHNLKHTVDVYTQVELIGRSEDVSLEEQLLLQTAALFHDAGHLIDYDTHEEMGVKLAREILPEYQYSERQIEIISDLIMVTKLPPKPKNLLEAIMCDADLDYLGRTDFIPVSNMLYKELHEHGRIGTIQEWNELQIKFIEKHQYFTNTARKLRNVNKNSQLENIKNWIEKNKL